MSHLPLQGGSWQALTDSGFSPSQWSPALHRTCLTSVPSPQVTEHYRNKGCNYRCLLHQDWTCKCSQAPTCIPLSSGVLSLQRWCCAVTLKTDNPGFTPRLRHLPAWQHCFFFKSLSFVIQKAGLMIPASGDHYRTKWRLRRQCTQSRGKVPACKHSAGKKSLTVMITDFALSREPGMVWSAPISPYT